MMNQPEVRIVHVDINAPALHRPAESPGTIQLQQQAETIDPPLEFPEATIPIDLEIRMEIISRVRNKELTPREAAQCLGLSVASIYSWANGRKISSVRDDNLPRDTPAAFARYMHRNPYYREALNRPLLRGSDQEGVAVLWAKVVEQAIESAGAIADGASETVRREIAKVENDEILHPRERYKKAALLKRNLEITNRLEQDKYSALSFLESGFFTYICQECNIEPTAARKAINKRLGRRARSNPARPKKIREKRMRIAGYAGL